MIYQVEIHQGSNRTQVYLIKAKSAEIAGEKALKAAKKNKARGKHEPRVHSIIKLIGDLPSPKDT